MDVHIRKKELPYSGIEGPLDSLIRILKESFVIEMAMRVNETSFHPVDNSI